MIVTTELKDKFLGYIVNHDGPFLEINFKEDCKIFNIDHSTLEKLIKYFVEIKFLESYSLPLQESDYYLLEEVIDPYDIVIAGGNYITTVHADTFYSYGGFYAQEELLKANIDKLGLELEKLAKELTPNHLDKLSKIGEIVNSISLVVNFIK